MGEGERLLDVLWDRYADLVPYAREFQRLAGGRFRTDHVAFRSLRRRGSGVEVFGPVFERLGWHRAAAYEVPDARISAVHFSHPAGLPRIVVSELVPEGLSYRARDVLAQLPSDPPPPEDLSELADWFRPPDVHFSEHDVIDLEEESHYGAWLLLFGREPNHFTAAVDDIEAWAGRLREAGVPMRAEIEGASSSPLRQIATQAALRPVGFRDGERDWPYGFFELAERREGFDGFIPGQSRQILEITRR
jgi:Domain of unknown function (DUF1338)